MRKHHRADRCGDQERTGEFEGPHVVEEEQFGERFDVAHRIRVVETDERGGRGVTESADEQDPESEPHHDGEHALRAESFHE